MKKKKPKYSFDVSTADGQKRLMAISMGLDSEIYIPKPVNLNKAGDWGCDPIGNNLFKMVPSGDIVDLEERNIRLKQ